MLHTGRTGYRSPPPAGPAPATARTEAMTKATRKPALTTQLKNAQAEIAALTKKVETEERNAKYAQARADEAKRELADVHAFLDAVPNPPANKTGEYSQPVSAMTRLSVFLATR